MMKSVDSFNWRGCSKLLGLLLVIGSIVLSLRLGCGTQLCVFFGAATAVVLALCMHAKMQTIQQKAEELIKKCAMPILIILFVGMLIGIWIPGGAIPSLVYYGLSFISPKVIVPLTFLLCSVMSLCTGTSFGSIATMGLALYGVGISVGVPSALMAGAVVSGAFFGDKMSPMSDTTNLAAATAGTPLYAHIGSMLYTTLPATLICLLLYTLLGLRYTGLDYDSTQVELMMQLLSEDFFIHPVCIVPALLLLILSMLKVHVILAMGSTVIVSMIFAMATQGASLSSLAACAVSGYHSSIGIAVVDDILSRGGIAANVGSVTIVFFSAIMAAALQAGGIMEVFKTVLLRGIRSTTSLIVSTLGFCYLMICITGNQMLGIVVPGVTLAPVYDRLHVSKRVLSRTLEDAATIGNAIVPWSGAFVYVCNTLGTDISYIPYAFLCYLVPVFSVLCAVTGIGVWPTDAQAEEA